MMARQMGMMTPAHAPATLPTHLGGAAPAPVHAPVAALHQQPQMNQRAAGALQMLKQKMLVNALRGGATQPTHPNLQPPHLPTIK